MNPELTTQTERALLGAIMQDNSRWSHVKDLSTGDFSVSSNSVIFGCMNVMFENGTTVDNVSLAQELDKIGQLQSIGDCSYLLDLLRDGEAVLNVAKHVEYLKEASTYRKFRQQYELLGMASTTATRNACLIDLQNLCSSTAAKSDWHPIFRPFNELANAPKLAFAIDGFLQEAGATIIAGLPGHSKTLFMLSMARAMLTGESLFGYFKVPKVSERVLYLIPESTDPGFWQRIQLFHLEDYVRSEKLLIHTLSCKEKLLLTDPRLLSIAKGSDIFIDTIARFMTGGEDIEDAREMADSLFGLLGAGARTITAAHHSPKAFETAKYMCLENVVRGSGDLGAAICTAWGLRQIDASQNRVYVQNVKPRDFEACAAFIVEGRPHLDQTGSFTMPEPPGFAGQLSDHLEKGGRPGMPDKEKKIAKARSLHAEGLSQRVIAETLDVSLGTVNGWLKSGVHVQKP